MCFSASASFGVSAVLLAGGIASLRKTEIPSQIPFAAISLIFSIQQCAEGVLWLSLTNTAYANWQALASMVFLLFAQVVWPLWVPASILLLEKDLTRKKILMVLSGLGFLVAAYLAYCLGTYHIQSRVSEHHILYEMEFPHKLLKWSNLFYVIPTVIPAFVSSVKKMSILGTTILVSFLISNFFFPEYIISVWCFFAAILSVLVLIIVRGIKRDAQKLPIQTTD